MHVPSTALDAAVLLVGVHGHGRWHLQNLASLAGCTGIRLAAVCDTRPLTDGQREAIGDVPVSADLGALLTDVRPDVTIVATPIHTHVDLALTALRAGSHVLLEKPPAPTLADHQRLETAVAGSARSCQIGFQSLGSRAVDAVRSLVAQGAIGTLRGIGGAGTWVRDSSYYERAAWAGRRSLDGVPVVDGALTNPFAHAVASALRIADAEVAGSLLSTEVELYRANDIEADDTACLRLRTSTGIPVTVAVTLCAEHSGEPYLVVHGERGRITLAYRRGEVRLEAPGVDRTTVHDSVDLLENLVAHVHDPQVALLVPPRSTRAFMEVVEAVRLAPEPVHLPERYRRSVPAGEHRRQVVPGIDALVARSAERLQLFSELGAPWAPGHRSG